MVIAVPDATEPRATRPDGPPLEATIRDGVILLDVLPDGAETTVSWTSRGD